MAIFLTRLLANGIQKIKYTKRRKQTLQIDVIGQVLIASVLGSPITPLTSLFLSKVESISFKSLQDTHN